MALARFLFLASRTARLHRATCDLSLLVLLKIRVTIVSVIFVLAETVAPTNNACCLNGKDKVIVVLTVEERHKALFFSLPCI